MKNKIKQIILGGDLELGMVLMEGQEFTNDEMIEVLLDVDDDILHEGSLGSPFERVFSWQYRLKINETFYKLLEDRRNSLEQELADATID